ncbi:triose-phosphate isomerase [Lacibacter sp. MH-610]|uniref:triose-phosphate isomerase n=1 Tax=Lacibacter sp. MH-610 TaxID=3020883 RepID=UPI003892257D
MRKQIAAANWKMNLTYAQGEQLVNDLLSQSSVPESNREVVLGVPFPYLSMVAQKIKGHHGYSVAAQNCSQHKAGAYTGETSAEMLTSIGVQYVILGHSERREYFSESNQLLADKLNIALSYGLTPIFCCGEPLSIREAETQNSFVETQLRESLFHLSAEELQKLVIAYEPIWAIGTGKTATADQAQDMHAHLRSVLAAQYGAEVANRISILYGGSVKGSNAAEIFSKPDVDGGLVGGASLKADEFIQVINGLK